MPLYRHPHLVRGVVHTPIGVFELNRGLADVPESVGEALGWQRCPEHADARTRLPSGQQATPVAPSDNVAALATSVDWALERVLAAVTAAVAGCSPIAVPECVFYVVFNVRV